MPPNESSAAAAAPHAVVIGAGPAGLMAAETMADDGVQVDVYDAMPSVGRKLLLAGRGGLNLTHSEPPAAFLGRYDAPARAIIERWLRQFDAAALRAWADGLGAETFVGSSGRVFPAQMKAAPLLRAWLARLRAKGVRFHMRHRWLGWDETGRLLRFRAASAALQQNQEVRVEARAVVLALGGGSWARLGSDGAWVDVLQAADVPVRALAPANCGFEAAWTSHFVERFAGQPVKSVAASTQPDAAAQWRRGEFMVTASGIEGGLVYALSAQLREQASQAGQACMWVDLLPDVPAARVAAEVARPRGARSLSSHLQSRLNLKGVKMGLLRQCLTPAAMADPRTLAQAIKRLPVTLHGPRPIDEAISSAGGVRLDAVDEGLMLRQRQGVFCAGEMLDWEAPTGGYLLTAAFASGVVAGAGVLRYLRR